MGLRDFMITQNCIASVAVLCRSYQLTTGNILYKKLDNILVFKFDEYSWYRNCLDAIKDTIGKVGVVGDEVLGKDGKWTIYIDAPQVWILRPKAIMKIMPTIKYYEGRLQ